MNKPLIIGLSIVAFGTILVLVGTCMESGMVESGVMVTGSASCLIGAMILHAFLGAGGGFK